MFNIGARVQSYSWLFFEVRSGPQKKPLGKPLFGGKFIHNFEAEYNITLFKFHLMKRSMPN
jgi:hypothetical protein